MALFDEEEWRNVLETVDDKTARPDFGTTDDQRLGRLTIACLIINRTVGSGIFVSPAKVLRATGSMGASLCLWVFGGLFALSGVLVWLEFGLTIPRHTINGTERSVPRSGGEKNYLEYVYTKPKYLTTCMFGIAFILLGNLSGNAYAFGIYVVSAAGYTNQPKALIIGIALVALTVAILIHMFTRRGGIYLNNGFAILKMALVLAIIVLGIIKAAGNRLGGAPNALDNYHHAFKGPFTNAASFADGFVYVAYAFTGFEQPFYVLSEFRRPQARFTRYTVSTVTLLTFLYVAVNVSYYFVVPVRDVFESDQDLATMFFERVFGNDIARRAMAAIIATSIFGNIVVMTFTAARVKQEIAKEGILWKSLFWATGRTTPAVKILSWLRRRRGVHNPADDPDQQEQTPMAGLLLHWIFSVVLIAVTAFTTPSMAYSILVSLYTYVVVVVIGFFVSLGLLLLKLVPSWSNWHKISHFQSGRILGMLPAAFYMLTNAFLMVMAFISPTPKPSYNPYFLVPVIGVTAPLWGFIWWCGIKIYENRTSKRLTVRRAPLFVQEKDKHGTPLDTYLQRVEIVERTWRREDPHHSGPYGSQYEYGYVEASSYEPKHR